MGHVDLNRDVVHLARDWDGQSAAEGYDNLVPAIPPQFRLFGGKRRELALEVVELWRDLLLVLCVLWNLPHDVHRVLHRAGVEQLRSTPSAQFPCSPRLRCCCSALLVFLLNV